MIQSLLQRLPPIWREAIDELWRRRLRTLLTLLGLIFGVGAIESRAARCFYRSRRAKDNCGEQVELAHLVRRADHFRAG